MEELKKKFINDLVKENAFFVRKKPFDLHSGGKSHLYVNPMSYIIKPDNLIFTTAVLIQMIKNLNLTGYKLVSCPSIAGPILTTALALKLNKEFIITTESEHEALKTKIHGNVDKGDKILVIDDVTTTGSSIVEVSKMLRKFGAKVNHTVVLVISHMNALNRLKMNGIECHYFISLREIIDTLWDNFSEEEKKIIEDEIKEVSID